MKHLIYNSALSLLFILLVNSAWSQQQKISVTSSGRSLSEVLEEVSVTCGVNFAFDPNSFRKIETHISLKEATEEEFLNLLLDRYSVSSRLIDGTWVLILREMPAIIVTQPPAFVTLSGYIRDKKTGENLIYGNVAYGENRGGMTNELGFFSFKVPAVDSVKLSLSHLGYHKLDTILPPDSQNILILLKPSEIMLQPIRVVHTEREVLQASPHPEKIAFNPLKSTAVPRVSNDDMGNALLLIPGISFFQGGASGLSIRGGLPADNLVLFDGIPVLETSHLMGNISVLNAKFIQQAFVSRGGFDASYGGRVAGLIELTGKSGKNNIPYLDVSANLLNSNILANLPVTGKFSITAAWRRSFIDSWQNYLYYRLIDNVSASDDNQVTSFIFPVVRYQDVNTKISFHPSDNFQISLNLLYGKDRQSRNFELFQTQDYYRNERVKSENLGLSINLKWQPNPAWYHALSAGYSTWEKDLVDETGELKELTEIIPNPGQGVGKGKGLAKTREKTYTRSTHDIDNGFNTIEEYRASWKTTLNTGILKHEAGAGWTFNSFHYDFFASRLQETLQIDSITRSAQQNLLHAFFQQNIDPSGRLQARWGVRANFRPENREVYWQPRGGIEVKPGKSTRVYFLSGIYYQFLSGIRRFDSNGHFSHIWYLPEKDGKGIVIGTHYILGGKFEKNGWYIDVEAYKKNTKGKMNLFAESFTSGQNTLVKYIPRQSNQRNQGADLFIQKKHFLFNHMLSYSYSIAEEKTEKLFDNNWHPAFNNRTHQLKITEMMTWRNWTFTTSWQAASGLPVLRLTGETAEETFTNSDPFAQLDLALMKRMKMSFYSVTAGVSVLNVFNRNNIVEVNYLRFSSETSSMTLRSDISALGFAPVFFLSLNF